MLGCKHRCKTLLRLTGLNRQAHAEDWRCRRRAIAIGTAAPSTGHPVVPHEVTASGRFALVAPTHQEVFKIETTSQRAVRQYTRPKFEHCVHDLLVRARAEARHRYGMWCVYYRAGRQVRIDESIKTRVQWYFGKESLSSGYYGAKGATFSRIEEAANRRMRARKIVVHCAASYRHGHANGDQTLAGRQGPDR